jgi:hypothetical protein
MTDEISTTDVASPRERAGAIFAAFDSRDVEVPAQLMTDDVRLQLGNAPPAVRSGHVAVLQRLSPAGGIGGGLPRVHGHHSRLRLAKGQAPWTQSIAIS